MKNFTLLGRLPLLVVCFLGLLAGSAQAQFCNLNSSLIEVEVMNTCDVANPTVFVNFNSFNIEGSVIIEYKPVFAQFVELSNVTYIAEVEAVNGFTSFEIADPIINLGGMTDNYVRITSVSVTGGCTQSFTGNEVVSNDYNLVTPSDITITNLNTTDPPCPGIPTGQIAFSFNPSTPNAPGFTDFTRFEVRQTPFNPNVFTTLNPPNNPPNNTNRYRVTTNQGLVTGEYTFLINDLQTGCETPYTVSIGGMFDVATNVVDASCFGVSDGEITIIPDMADPQVNGPLSWSIVGPGESRSGIIVAASANTYNTQLETDFAAGTYTVTLTASSGDCMATEVVNINEPDEITVASVSAATICGEDTDFTVEFSGITGLDANGRFRLLDGSITDGIPGNNNGCWTRPVSGRSPLSGIDNGDGSYTFTSGVADALLGCRDINVDTTVVIDLELYNSITQCFERFPFTLQIDAQPETPSIEAFAIVGVDDTISGTFCSGQDIELYIPDYDPAFTYSIAYVGASAGLNIDSLGAFASSSIMYTGSGSVIGSFVVNRNSAANIDFELTQTNMATGCSSIAQPFTVRVRPLPTLDPLPTTSLVCSDEEFSILPVTNGGNNGNILFDYSWDISGTGLSLESGFFSETELDSGDDITTTFRNLTGMPQNATLTVTPTFPQNNPLIGGGNIDNECEGASHTIVVTISPQPVLTYNLEIGDSAPETLESGDIRAYEICSGEDFLLNTLDIQENTGGKLAYVEFKVAGDAGFLQIPPGTAPQYLPIGNFAIGVNDVQNNNPDNNAQVAEITLTPYFQNQFVFPGGDFPECAGEPITLFLTVNPTAPTLMDQSTVVCSDERIMYTIAGASNMMGQLETRITSIELFENTTDYVIPAGAARVDSFTFNISGANGGGTEGFFVGGRGGVVTGSLSDMEIFPGDTVRIRKGDAGGVKPTNGDGGDATTLVVIAGDDHPTLSAGDEAYVFVAGGGGGAGSGQSGQSVPAFNFGGNPSDGTQGQGPGGFGGTGYSNGSLGGDGLSNGGGGGGGWTGGNGGNSQAGASGVWGSSYASGGTAFFANKNFSEAPEGNGRIFLTVVYDDIRFSLDERIVDPSLIETTAPGQEITDGEVDTILWGQQFLNPTNEPLDVTYVFATNTEANCSDGGLVEIVVTIEPEPTGFMTSGTTTIAGDAASGYTATVCSGDALEAFLNTTIVPTTSVGSVYFLVSTSATPGTGFFGGNGQNASASSDFGGQNNGQFFPLRFFENGFFNNTGALGTVTYTITPYIFRANDDDCAGDPFTFTVDVLPGYANNQLDLAPAVVNVCSQDAFSDAGFDFAATQTGVNNPFNEIRLVGYRILSNSADFTTGGTVDTTGVALGGKILTATDGYFNDHSYRNLTGSGVTVEYDVRLRSDDGCESTVITYEFNIRAEPVISDANNTLTVCSGDALGIVVGPAANSAFSSNFALPGSDRVTLDYFLDAPNLVATGVGSYPAFDADNSLIADDAFENNTTMPQTAIYKVVGESRFGCVGDTVTYTITVLPRPDISITASQGANSISGLPLADVDTLTICSGSSVDFTLDQPVTGTAVSYRLNRQLTANITDLDGNPIPGVSAQLPVENFNQGFINTGNATESVRFAIRAYTFGPDGIDNSGNGDDCRGETAYLFIDVLPATTDETALTNELRVNSAGNGLMTVPSGTQICDNSEVRINPSTTLDPASGAAFIWRRENDGTLLAGDVMGTGGFQSTTTGGVYRSLFADQIREVLTAVDATSQEVRYIVSLYSFGADGVNDFLAPGSDDCVGDIDTITVLLDPTPTLTYDLQIGADTETLDESGSPYIYEICSGDDFLISNLNIPELADGKMNNVKLRVRGQMDFLGLTANVNNRYEEVALASTFSLGATNVQNTSGSNNAQSVNILITPYFEDGNDPTDINNEECVGEPIRIIVTLNPTPPALGPFSEVVCSEDRVEYTIPGASGQGGTFRSRVAGVETFDSSNDFVVPEGAVSIRDIDISMSGANGGAADNTRGGLGATLEALTLNPNAAQAIVMPGDTIRVRKGMPGDAGSASGNGGDATLVCVIAGPQSPAPLGSIVQTYVAAGGGGAGFGASGGDAFLGSNSPNTYPAGDGADGAGLGGFGGTGWNMTNPASGSLGGAGRSNGGGGGGGYQGGDGGSNISGAGGDAGTSYAGFTALANFGTKSFSDPAGGEVSMTYTLVFDEVRFSLVNRSVGAGLVDQSENPLVNGESDTILHGEQFFNPTDEPIDVTYLLATSSEAACPGGQVEITLTIEPNPTLELASGTTVITDNGDDTYSAEICSGDSLSAFLSSATMPSAGANWLRARVVDVDYNATNVTFGTSNNGQHASGSNNFGGNNQPAVADVFFFESSITNVGTTVEEVVYTIVPLINGNGAGTDDCFGDTLFLTVSVNPAVITVAAGPIQNNICSNESIMDSGFDLLASQPGVQIDFDSILIDTVFNSLGMAGDMDFDTISSDYAGVPLMVRKSADYFGGDVFRNRTGGPVTVTYDVRLVSGPGCFSDPIRYEFRYTAEPVILTDETASNQIDTTICTGETTGLVVYPAANSAWSNPADFQQNVLLSYIADIPTGITLTGANYPTTGGRFVMTNNVLENMTDAPLDVTFTVTPSNNGCEGDPVIYTVTVNPNPDATVQLVSLDSVASFSLENSRAFLVPNPEFVMCSGQALNATVPAAATADNGTLMAVMTITYDPAGFSGYTVGTPMRFPASELADSLTYAMGEIENLTGMPDSFTVEYFTFFEANGTPGNQNDGVDCGSNGIVEFNVVVNPVNSALVRVDDTNGNTIASGNDTLCSGAAFDLVVRAVTNNPALPAIDSFLVEVHAPAGTVAGMGTESTDFWVTDQNGNAPYGRRLEDLSFENVTAGIKTIQYIAIPYSGGCAGIPDTITISFRPETVLELNQPIVCAMEGVPTAIFNVDVNGQPLTTANADYRWEFIGGTASGFSITRANGNGFEFVGDPVNQANTIVFNNEYSLVITPAASLVAGEINFEVIYDNLTNGACGTITDTVTLILSQDAMAGTPDPTLGVLCDGVNFLLSDALLDESPGGVFTFSNGDPVPDAPNFTPMVGGTGTDPVAIEFTYTAGGGNSGCTEVSTNFTIMVEPAPSAGTVIGVGTEACQGAAFLNLYDLLTTETQGGTFTQTSGTDFVAVGADGVFDQSGVTPGVYTYDYEVTSSFGCAGDMVSGISFEVVSSEDCSTPISCDVIELVAGFNVISFDVIPNDNSIRNIFADVIADESLVQIIGLRADANNGIPQTFAYVPVIIPGSADSYVGTIDGGIQGGYGYIVQMEQAATIEVCGPDVDVDLRVELQAGPNFVGYAAQMPEAVDTYFDELIMNSDLNSVRTLKNGLSQDRVYGILPFPIGPLAQMENGFGYILDVNTAYANGSWKINSNIQPTSVFDQFYGKVENGKRYVGETFQFANATGEVFGEVSVNEHGTYFGAYLFGDVTATEDEVEGFLEGEEVFISYQGQLIETGITFNGSWTIERLDVNLESVLSDVEESIITEFSVSVYPNPTSGLATVEITIDGATPEFVRTEVFNSLGQLVISRTIENLEGGLLKTEIDLSDLAAGAYQLRLVSDDGVLANQQLIKR